MLQPDQHWQWRFDGQKQRLLLLLNDMVFVSPYSQKQLKDLPYNPVGFDLNDLDNYSRVQTQLEKSLPQMSPGHKTQLAINACAVLRFHKNLTPKSWYFTSQHNSGHHHQLAFLSTQTQSAQCWVLEQNSISSLCMLLDKELSLDAIKTLTQFQCIRVMKDRLEPCYEIYQQLKQA